MDLLLLLLDILQSLAHCLARLASDVLTARDLLMSRDLPAFLDLALLDVDMAHRRQVFLTLDQLSLAHRLLRALDLCPMLQSWVDPTRLRRCHLASSQLMLLLLQLQILQLLLPQLQLLHLQLPQLPQLLLLLLQPLLLPLQQLLPPLHLASVSSVMTLLLLVVFLVPQFQALVPLEPTQASQAPSLVLTPDSVLLELTPDLVPLEPSPASVVSLTLTSVVSHLSGATLRLPLSPALPFTSVLSRLRTLAVAMPRLLLR
jgi:hypothetical protein